MTAAGAIAGIIPVMQSTALLASNVKTAKKPTTKGIVKQGVTNIVGLSLIGETAALASLI